jgi:cytochrome c
MRLLVALALPLALWACGGGQDQSVPADETGAPVTEAQVVAASGESEYRACAACHSIDKGGSNRVGPNLHGIVGRAVASAEGYGYSAALKAKGGVWDEAALDAFLTNPRKAVPGTKMAFPGLSDNARRKALIDYLAAQK